MADEIDTTSEVARVLIEHTRLMFDGKCHCGFQGRLGESFTAHQAEALAEAGLLRDPALIEERDMLKRGGAELGRQIDHYLTWVLDATGMHHLIDEDGDGDWELVWERLSEMGRAWKDQHPQIATQEPAGAPGIDSAGPGASGGLGERLRALVTGADPKATHEAVDVAELGRLADEVDVLEAAYRVADAEIARLSEFHDHYRAQVEAIRAAITREAAHGDAITRCNLVAKRFQTVLDSVSAP